MCDERDGDSRARHGAYRILPLHLLPGSASTAGLPAYAPPSDGRCGGDAKLPTGTNSSHFVGASLGPSGYPQRPPRQLERVSPRRTSPWEEICQIHARDPFVPSGAEPGGGEAGIATNSRPRHLVLGTPGATRQGAKQASQDEHHEGRMDRGLNGYGQHISSACRHVKAAFEQGWSHVGK